jgi:bacteriorhodopsin
MEILKLNNKNNNITKNTSKDENENEDKDIIVKYSFYITYSFLMTTATVTFIEALRTKDAKIRHILNLETCISIVATLFYGMFISKINEIQNKNTIDNNKDNNKELNNKEFNYKDINTTRYIDWSITTPIMLLVLLLAFCYNNKKNVIFWKFLIVLVLNYGMLFFGYLGENKKINKITATTIGFLFFFALYYYIYVNYIQEFKSFDNQIIYWSFFIFWSLYGVVYWLNERNKNIFYNILDLFSKCFVGIFFWAYFTKSIVL